MKEYSVGQVYAMDAQEFAGTSAFMFCRCFVPCIFLYLNAVMKQHVLHGGKLDSSHCW